MTVAEEKWPELQNLLEEFKDVFREPKGLAPQRLYGHRIPIKEGVVPINSRPYKYGPEQKSVIEGMVKEMLDAEIIQHSNNLYTSSMLLVKNKDKIWRRYIDYRLLNNITTKISFLFL